MLRVCAIFFLLLLFPATGSAGVVDDINSAITEIKNRKPENAKVILAKIVQDAEVSADHKSLAYFLLSFAEKNTGEAIIYCNKAVEISPKDARFHERLGVLYFDSKNFAKSIDMLSKTLEISPANASALSMRGIAYREIGNTESALQDLDKAISLAPSEAIHYARRGVARFIANQHDTALTDFASALDKGLQQPVQGICYYYAAKIYQQRNDYKKAKSLYKDAASLLIEEEKKQESLRMVEQIEASEKWS